MKSMQHLILALALLISSMIFAQESSEKGKEGIAVMVTVTNALNNKGTVNFALFNEENFLKQPIYAKSASVENGKSTVIFEGIPKGFYAIICFQDENNNSRMDFDENGMPKENYGLSNNNMNFGPPQFEDSKFEVKDNSLNLEIKF